MKTNINGREAGGPGARGRRLFPPRIESFTSSRNFHLAGCSKGPWGLSKTGWVECVEKRQALYFWLSKFLFVEERRDSDLSLRGR